MPVSEFFKRLKRNKRKTVDFKFVNGLLLVLISISIVYYVAGINDLVVKGFELQELRSHSESLSNENKNYNNYVTSLKSYNNLEKRIERLGMVETGEVDYIRKQSAVAVR